MMTQASERVNGSDESVLIRVRDSAGYKEFQGRLLSHVSTETPELPRWTEMHLYKVTDGTERYVLKITGRSVVYHAHDGRCNSGVPMTVTSLLSQVGDDGEGLVLLDELEPCQKCQPAEPEELEALTDGIVDVEEDRHTVHVCATADAVVNTLRNPKSMGSRGAGMISGPGQRLLAAAALVDAGVKNAVTTVDRL